MLRSECFLGQQVMFGRNRGEKSLGKVVKINQKTAKVELLEERGVRKAHAVGGTWKVPFTLMSPAEGATPQASTPTQQNVFDDFVSAATRIHYSRFLDAADNHILMAILDVYSDLSPENLACDGEASASHVRQHGARLRRKLAALETALGRKVSEDVVYDWYAEKQESDRKDDEQRLQRATAKAQALQPVSPVSANNMSEGQTYPN